MQIFCFQIFFNFRFIEDGQLKAGMEIAICVHIAKAYAQDLIKQIDIKLSKLPTSAQQFLTNIKKALETDYWNILINNLSNQPNKLGADEHQKRCEDLITWHGATVEEILAIVTDLDPTKETELVTKSHSDKTSFTFTCPPGHTISKITGTKYNGAAREGYDRTWSFACRPTVISLDRLVDCTEEKWIPYIDDNIYQLFCTDDAVVSGVRREHTQQDSGGERWMIKCCKFVAKNCKKNCENTGWTSRETDVLYQEPSDWYLTGFETIQVEWEYEEITFPGCPSWLCDIFTYTKKDRRFNYRKCRVEKCD